MFLQVDFSEQDYRFHPNTHIYPPRWNSKLLYSIQTVRSLNKGQGHGQDFSDGWCSLSFWRSVYFNPSPSRRRQVWWVLEIRVSLGYSAEYVTGYESVSERWSPVQTPETILLSVISMLSGPNDESPANVEAARLWREDPKEFRRRCRKNVRESLGDEWRIFLATMRSLVWSSNVTCAIHHGSAIGISWSHTTKEFGIYIRDGE